MRKLCILLSVLLIAFSSCQKDPAAAQQAAIDDAVIQEFITTNHISATRDPSGLYYSVLNPGNGIYPALSSTVTATYTGFVINGNYFATNLTLNSRLSTLIRGWQIGLPHIKTGGTIILLIPSALGYGNSLPNNVSTNSSLVYNIVLNNVTN